MMCRKKIIAVLIVLGMTICGSASSTIVKYNFTQSGFDDGAIVTGMFAGEDLDGDGFLVGNEGPDGINEITDFNMAFSGNSKVPAFTINMAGFDFLVYRLDGGSLGDIEDEDELIAAPSFDADTTAGVYLPNGFSSGTNVPDQCKNSYCAFVFVTDVDFEPNNISYSFESVTVSAVPLPAAAWLFGSGLLGLIGVRQIKNFCKISA
jgi:hypothetical protein